MDQQVVSIEENKKADTEADFVKGNKDKNETVATELQFELLKQYAWLSSAITGAVVILIQLKILSFSTDLYISFFCFGASIFISLFGQDFIADSLIKGKTIYCIANKVKIFRCISMFTLFVGVGVLLGTVTKDFV